MKTQLLLSGQYEHTLDPKGRVTLPAAFRSLFEDGAWAVRLGDEKCLRVYTPEGWQGFDQEHFAEMDDFADEDAKWKLRQIYGNLDSVGPDKQGRILLSSQRIAELALTGKVMICGVRSHIEIWNPDTYAQELGKRSIKGKSENA
jgi:MraZ protein